MSEGLDILYFRLALRYAKQRDLSKAVFYAGSALLLNSGNKEALLLKGLCLHELGELSRASEALGGAIGLNESGSQGCASDAPDGADSLNELRAPGCASEALDGADSLNELREPGHASEALDGAAGLREEALAERGRTDAIVSQARDLVSRNKWRKAEALLRSVGHQSVRILVMRGCIKAASDDYKAAAALFARALEKDRGNNAAAAYLTEAASRL